jgi:hypothetical protein
MKRKITHPNFYLGLVAFLLLFIGIGFRANGYQGGDYVIAASAVLGGIHWIWAIFDVFASYRRINGPENKQIIWVIIVLLIPTIGSMLYYIIGDRVRI